MNRTRAHGTIETLPDTPAERVAAIRQIVHSKQYAKVDGCMVDLFTASAIIMVYDNLNEANQLTFASMPAANMGRVAFKLVRYPPLVH